ncbi:MAG: RagB/SusD family nutrient uptake outer membrane protein [Saprospiraceae bacterium]
MKNMTLKTWMLVAIMSLGHQSCFNDLNTEPLDKDEITSIEVYKDPTSYKKVLAKIYAGLALSGQQGPSGIPDIAGIDEGFSTYLRQYWKAQELPTDEAVIGWNDGNIADFHQQDWDAANEFVTAMYNRIFYQISLCNEFLRETTEPKLDSRSITGTIRTDIALYRNEVRFLRALSYYHALDMFRNVPFVTEADAVGNFFPKQIDKTELFAFIEKELKEIESTLKPPKGNEYGRADQGAVWMLLAKLYLNAETYIGVNKYTDCVTYSNKVISGPYSLAPKYANNFTADNNKSPEMIFPIVFDGTYAKTWGGMTFVVHAAVGGSMNVNDFGVDGGWGGTRTTSAIVKKFTSGKGGDILVTPLTPNTSFKKIYAPGGYQGWDPAKANTFTSPADNGVFEGYINFTETTEFKFTTGPNWDENFGDNGADGTLEKDGANLKLDAGFYKVSVDIPAKIYTIKKTTWGVIGSATPTGWDSDTDLKYDAKTNSWSLTINLVKGDLKFRANDGWDLNYGDNGANASLEENGANIAIPSDGTYIIKLFLDRPDYSYQLEKGSIDSRGMFYTTGQNLEIADISQFTEGYAVTKYKNVTSDGKPGSDKVFMDTDFPLFRLADAYLMLAEAVLRGGAGATKDQALQYINALRQRAFNGTSGNLTAGDLSLEFILDERARELLWECTRRTDLVRFGKFSQSSYVWPWKGGVPEGKTTDKKYDVYPIPSSDLGANPNLKQNPGY